MNHPPLSVSAANVLSSWLLTRDRVRFAREFIKQSCKFRSLYQPHVLICVLSHESQFTYTRLAAIIFPGGGVVPKVLSGDVRSNLKTVPYFGPKSPIYHALSYFLDLREKLILHLRPLKLWHGSNTWSQITMNDFDLQKLTNLRRLMQNNCSLKTEWYPMPSQKENPTL